MDLDNFKIVTRQLGMGREMNSVMGRLIKLISENDIWLDKEEMNLSLY